MKQYITIEREYGSGGKEVASRLAQELQIPCYGQEILEEAAASLQVSVSKLQRYEEHICNSLLYSVVMIDKARTTDPDQMLRDGYWVIAEQRAIRTLAKDGPAIFVGHCACEALREYPNVLRVFIRGSMEDRKQRCTSQYGIQPKEVESTIRRFDRTRASYFSMNTTADWRCEANYDVVLDSSVLGIDGCVEQLKVLAESF